MDRSHIVTSLLRPLATLDRLKSIDAAPVSSWDKEAATRRPQLVQLPSGPVSAPKKLQQQQQQHASPNQRSATSLQPLPKTSGIRLNRSTKRVTKVPKLSFTKRRGRNAISNQFSLDGARQVNAGVYLLENVNTGHRYFGTTWDLQNAAAQSFHDLQLGVHPHQALSTCFILYGEAASGIRFRVLEQVSPPSSPKPPVYTDQVRAKRRRIKRLLAGREADNNEDGFDVRAMERKLATRLRFHHRKVVRRAAYKIVRRFLVMPILARAWPLWVRAAEGCALVERTAATVEIQRVARGYLDRVMVDKIRRDRAARTLQRFMRRCHFTLACRRRARSRLESKAARVLQRSMREFVARCKARRRRDGVRRWLAARKLQTHVRRHLARRLVDRMRLDKRRARAAVDMQRTTRGHLARLRVQRQRQRRIDDKAATDIQKIWRGYSTRTKVTLRSLGALSTHRLHHCSIDELRDEAARTIQQAYSRWEARRLREQNEKATTIRLAYRNYVARKFGWAAVTVMLETAMANQIQRAGRRWMFQRKLRRVVNEFRRDKAALTIQCCTRQHHARLKLYRLRKKKKCAQAIRQIQAFWRGCWMLLNLLERILKRKRERAAKRIQATYRAWIARREYVAIRDLARRNRAATKMQCMFRARQARRELMRRQVVRRLGACESCRSQLATVYHFEAESELCAACSDEFASLGDAVMETIDVTVYRRILVPLMSAQRAYRAFQTQMRLRFGTCTLCEKHAVRRSCWSCLYGQGFTANVGKRNGKPAMGLTFCRSCDALFHERKQHQRKDIELAYTEDAAAVTIQKYYRRFAQRCTVADLRLAQQTLAAKRVQVCFRRHRQRRITRAICAAHRRQQVLEAGAALTIQRAVRGYLARCELLHLKYERDSAIKIQRAFRRYQARRVYNAAVVIQSHVRGWLARRVACILRQERRGRQQNAAACCIQRHVRGFLARRRVWHLRQHKAAVRIQSAWRGYVARCELHALQLEKQRRFNEELRTRLSAVAAQIAECERAAATCIQTEVRGRQARIELYRRKLQAARSAREQLRDNAVALEAASATCIQRHVRERLTAPVSHHRLRAQCCARCFLSRRTVKRMRLEKQSAVRIQRAFRYSRAKRRLARLVDDDTTPASAWVELFDEASGCVYYYHTETGESVWERPAEMDTSPEDATSENVGEWVEYWDENVGTSYFYNVKTGEATWATPAGYQSSNLEDTTTAETWPLNNGDSYYTLQPRSKLESKDAENQKTEVYGDQYAPYGYEDQAYYDNNHEEGAYYYYGDGTAYAYPDDEPVDTEYDINYKIYLTQIAQEQQQQQQQQQQDQKPNDTKQA
ncbi:hypothetical protein L917_06943 [Phytophthora nicotianae]|uniref:WW domain-containing protein n=1 Tax=Phytophthora nicotianae TaxID=4792 RepID=W2LCM7_PHYNI|nr:hypothetical protein L917_06943 [Phytophthora nicotianae]